MAGWTLVTVKSCPVKFLPCIPVMPCKGMMDWYYNDTGYGDGYGNGGYARDYGNSLGFCSVLPARQVSGYPLSSQTWLKLGVWLHTVFIASVRLPSVSCHSPWKWNGEKTYLSA